MAGDWIKVEKETPHKPEVLKIARMLGIPRREAFGLIVEFWMWLDGHCVDGVVDGVVDADVDALMSCPGFAAMLKLVKWASFEPEPPRMVIANFGRHNGESSKKRALKNERQSSWRGNVDASVDAHVDAPVSTKASTREEKRRDIDTSLRSVSIARKKKRAQQIESPTEEHEAIAAERGISCQAEFAKYRDWQASTGKRHKDEVAGFRNWLRNARVLAPADELQARKLQAARNMDIITGRARERTIEGVAERVGGAVVLPISGDLRESGADDVGECGPTRVALGVG